MFDSLEQQGGKHYEIMFSEKINTYNLYTEMHANDKDQKRNGNMRTL